MLQYFKSRIEDTKTIDEFNRHLGAGIFIVIEESRCIYPIQKIYKDAIYNLHNLSETDLEEKKIRVKAIIDELISFREEKIPGRSFALFPKSEKDTAFEYGVLLIEQDNIDFFKKRDSDSSMSPHERIHHHFAMAFGNRTVINIHSNELPDKIKYEIMDLFSSIYPPMSN